MKKLMAMILTFAMVMSLCVVPASAAGSGVTITITPDQSKVDTTTGDAVVTYTVKAKVTDPNLKVGSLTITLDPGAGLTLADKDEDTDSAFYYQENVALKYDKTYNKTGIFGAEFSYAPLTKTFVAVGTTQDRNLNSTHGEVTLMTIMGKIAKGTTGSVTLKTTQHSYGDPSGSTASVDCDVTPATVTITKAPIDSVTASVNKPVAGQALDTTVDVGGATAYTGAVEWYEGDSATGTAATGKAKANTKYTAKITLTAGSGESFADSVTIPADYTKDSSSTSSKLVLTRTFDETGNLPAASVTDIPTAKSGLKYDGTKKDLLGFKGNASGGTMQYRLGDSGEFTTAIPMATDAGTYTVYYMAKGDSTHSDSAVASISAKIDPKDISTATIGTIASQSYTGSAITPDPEVKDGTTNLEKGKDYTVSCTDKYVGTAELTITGKGNYTGTKDANFAITAVNQNPTFTTPVDLVTGGHRLDLRTLVNGAEGDMIFAIASGNAATLSGHELTSTGITGVVKIKVSIAAKDMNGDTINEYNAFSKSEAITVNVVDKTPASVTTAPEAVANLKYNGNEQKLVTEGTADGGTMQYSLGSSSWSTDIPTAKDAGTYSVQYKVVGDSGHTDTAPVTLTVKIDPKVLQSSDLEKSGGSATKVYDGNATSSITVGVKASSLYGTDTLPINGSAVYNSANVNEANTITFTPNAITTGNYTLAATEKLTINNASITPRDLTVTPNAGQSKKFGDADPTLHSTNSGRVTGQIPDFSGALSRAEGEDVGQYDITQGTLALIDHFSSGFKASNYTLKMVSPAVKFEITKADAPTAPTGLKGYKDSTLSTVTLPTGWSWVNGTLKMDTIGDQTFKANYAGDTNHEAGNNVDVTVKVVQKSSGGYYYAPTTAVVPDMPMLYRGCTGDAVKTLQDKLNALGYNSGNVDGIFGAKTYAAVTAFQKANSLGVDGIVGKLTWGKLYGVSPAMPVETTTVVGRPMVSYGSRGDAVRKLQELLNALGYDCGSVDGIFGSKTKAAVLAFQKANGLGVDGIVGPLTWAKLG